MYTSMYIHTYMHAYIQSGNRYFYLPYCAPTMYKDRVLEWTVQKCKQLENKGIVFLCVVCVLCCCLNLSSCLEEQDLNKWLITNEWKEIRKGG